MPDNSNQHTDFHEERRQGSRFGRLPSDDYAAVWKEHEQPLLAEVHDESLHGISLILDTDSDIRLGTQVYIVYAGMCHLAQARHLETRSDGRMLVGFKCDPLPEVSLPH